MVAKEGELGGASSAQNKFGRTLVLCSIYIRMDLQWSLNSPFGLQGVVRDSLTIAWDTLFQEVVMLAKEEELGGVPIAKNQFGRKVTLFYIYKNAHAMISVLSFWIVKCSEG